MKFKNDIIKEVSYSDLKRIYNLEKRLFKEDTFSKESIKSLITNNTFFFKIEKGMLSKKLIGFIIIVKDRKDRVNIINFLIEQKYQNKGYGSFLLKKTIEKIKELGEIKKIILNVKISNIKAVKLYRKFNFKIIQTQEKYYHHEENAYLMELTI